MKYNKMNNERATKRNLLFVIRDYFIIYVWPIKLCGISQ